MGFAQKRKKGAKNSLGKPSLITKKMSKAAKPIACVVFLTFLAGIILAIFVAIGCVAPTSFVDQLSLFELRTNDTYDIRLRVGYFGALVEKVHRCWNPCDNVLTCARGCLLVANQTGNQLPTDEQRHCVANMRTEDLDDLSEELWEDLQLSEAAQAQVKASLNATLTQAVQLQRLHRGVQINSRPAPRY